MNLNGKFAWWSWFIIGAVGLNISNYSLAGVEAGMLASTHFNINKNQIIWHTDKSWSTLGAWKILGASLYYGLLSKNGEKRMPSLPWMILFGLSILSWAFVLSGLTMNLSSGYTSGNHAGAIVIGVNATTMNNRVPFTVFDSAFQRWQLGTQPQIPSGGALYASPGSAIIANISTPNILPGNVSEGIFIAPQTSLPVTGSAWGLLLNYSCTAIHNLAEFTILNHRMNSTSPGYIHKYSEPDFSPTLSIPSPKGQGDYPAPGTDISFIDYYYALPANGSSYTAPTINVLSQQGLAYAPTPQINIQAVAEIGLSPGFGRIAGNLNTGYTSYNYTPGVTYGGLSDVDVLEVLLWQSSISPPNTSVTPVKDPIPGLETEHLDALNNTMAAIGIRCTSSSAMGNAKIDGLAGTFSNFVREDPVPGYDYTYQTARLGIGAPFMLLQPNASAEWNSPSLFPDYEINPILANYSTNYSVVSIGVNWLQPLFTAGGIQVDTSVDIDYHEFTYSSCMQTDDLQSALEGVYAQYALQIMFSGQEVNTWLDSNLTMAVPWPVIVGAGGVPPLLVLVCLLVWAMGCLVLGVVYGPKKRWGDTFDGYSFLRYCKDVLGCDPNFILEKA